jgi:AcrR family transcriptional regulator
MRLSTRPGSRVWPCIVIADPGVTHFESGEAALETGTGSSRHLQIINAAADLFDRQGYAATTMDEIAAAVGIKKPTLYHHVKSKDEILFWITCTLIDQLIDQAESRRRARPTSPDLIRGYLADVLAVTDTHRGHLRALLNHFDDLTPPQRAHIAERRRIYRQSVASLVAACIDSGALRSDLDPEIATWALLGVVNWSQQWYRSGGRLTHAEIAERFWDIMLLGMAPREPGRPRRSSRRPSAAPRAPTT